MSKSIHENGTKHKLNVQKYLLDVDTQKVKEKEENEELEKTLKKIENAASRSYLKDLGYSSSTKPQPESIHSREEKASKNQNIVKKSPKTDSNTNASFELPNNNNSIGLEGSVNEGFVNTYFGIPDTPGLGPWVPVVSSSDDKPLLDTQGDNKNGMNKTDNRSSQNLVDEDDLEDISEFNIDSKKPLPFITQEENGLDNTNSNTQEKKSEGSVVFKKRKKPATSSLKSARHKS
ncbi:hypothetical protein BB560_003839 [Smittium megazygosporum]|uniref:U1-type domain-containing protein n=1 Tax=Smittium megazygosporum TaxID=133381 RepID=A0A2T9ZAX2_9FUNG|nr:hypothetical protein BB560_003839 [Smittium megazygosporum]